MSQALVELVREKFPEAVVASHSHRGDEVVTVRREDLLAVIGFLRNDPQAEMKLLRQIAAIDMLTYKSEMAGGSALASIEAPAYELQHKPRVEPRFYVSYNLYSIARHHSVSRNQLDDLPAGGSRPRFDLGNRTDGERTSGGLCGGGRNQQGQQRTAESRESRMDIHLFLHCKTFVINYL